MKTGVAWSRPVTEVPMNWPVALRVMMFWCLQVEISLPAAAMLARSSLGWPCLHTGHPLPQKHNASHKHLQRQRFIAAIQRKPHREMTNVYLECFQIAACLSPLNCWREGALPCPSLLTLQLGRHLDPALLDI